MSQPVVRFEIAGKDPERLRRSSLNSSIGRRRAVTGRERGSTPDGYGFVELITTDDGTASTVASEVARTTKAMRFSTWASRVSRRRCNTLRSSEH